MAVWDDVVADWFARPLPAPTPRRVRPPGDAGRVHALVGMRRAGKTWQVLGEIAEVRAAGAPPASQLRVSLADERLHGVRAEALTSLLDAWWRRSPEAAASGAWLVLEDVPAMPGWERFVRRALDEWRLRVTVTASSAGLLSPEVAAALRGRCAWSELLPFAFDEWLAHRGQEVPARWPPAPPERAALAHALDVYLQVGGFPEVAGASLDERRDRLRGHLDVVLLRDVIERHGDTNVAALRRLVRRFVASPGSASSVHQALQDLRAHHVAIGKDALYAAVAHLEDAFVGFRVPIRTDSERVRATNPARWFPIDPGLTSAFGARPEVPRLLSAAVYLELRRRGGAIAWHRTAGGREVDFVVDGDGAPGLFQVCADPADADARTRTVRALDEGMAELGAREATVITLEAHRRDEPRPGGAVSWVPAWEWLLGP